MSRSVIVLEFNELTPPLMNRFIEEGHLPNFARLRAESVAAVTDAEEAPPYLEPWIQWVTVHTGLPYSEHGVFALSEGSKVKAPRIWDVVAETGRPAWVCGSMNAAIRSEPFNGLVLPDPWSTDVQPHPAALFEPYMTLVTRYVHEHSQDKVPVSQRDYLRFARFMVQNGLSLPSVTAALRQLIGERSSGSRYRRASILDRLQWDLFRHHYRRLKPAFATFFLNSTAHYQHYFWRNLEPGIFAAKPSAEDQARYHDAILFGYQQMDKIVGDAMALADSETSVVMCTALSQQPMLKYEETGGILLFRPRDVAKLMAFAGITSPYVYAPIMAQEFYLHFENEADRDTAQEKLLAMRFTDGKPVFRAPKSGLSLVAACDLGAMLPEGTEIETPYANRRMPFDALFYPMDTVKSGMHHPDGLLWVRTPAHQHQTLDRKISLRQVAPTLARLCGIDPAPLFSLPPIAEVDEQLGLRQSLRAEAA